MKEFWYWVEEYDRGLIASAIEAGARAIVLNDQGKEEEVKKLGKVSILRQGIEDRKSVV